MIARNSIDKKIGLDHHHHHHHHHPHITEQKSVKNNKNDQTIVYLVGSTANFVSFCN